MCGIIGLIRPEPVEREEFRVAIRLLAHRGPDGAGHYFADAGSTSVALGHRRLSVIDLATGDQPMFDDAGQLAVVFNGEIYNYRELREELTASGHRFRTQSDTEVLVHGFQEWGSGLPARLNGMFAFAIHDRDAERLFLARDRLGQKPLFYTAQGDRFAFASELGPLRHLMGEGPFSATGLSEYLTHGFVSGGDTCYAEIRRLRPGHQMIVESGRTEVSRYWELPTATTTFARPRDVLEDELDDRLQAAVERRLISDVPLGAFLSGGLDSSLIVAMMARQLGRGVETFSISFADPSYDESAYARAAARFLGVRHRQEAVDLDDSSHVEELILSCGEPFGDSSAIPTRALSAVTRKHVTVALSGDGGDELFGGYQRYLARQLVSWYLRVPPPARRALRAVEARNPEGVEYYGNSVAKKLRLFLDLAERVERGVEGLPIVFTPAEIRRLFPGWQRHAATFPQRVMASLAEDAILEQMMALDVRTYLAEDILTKVDRMSMACSLEVRSPFMDPELVEFSRTVPASLKVHGWTTKYLLKRVALRYLPASLVHRRKHGFSVPMGRWFQQDLGDRFRETVGSLAGTVDRAFALELLEQHRRGVRDHAHRLWVLYVLLVWLQRSGTSVR